MYFLAIILVVASTCLAIGMPMPAGDGPGADSPPELAGLDFDIKNYATDAVWNQYVAKGDHLQCVMGATDVGAGFLIQDTRKPPSAASPWTGDLRRMCLRKRSYMR
jgi:hypothetical protein